MHRPNPAVPTPETGPLYTTWAKDDQKGQNLALVETGKGIQRIEVVSRIEKTSAADTYRNAATNMHVRDEYSRDDYDYFRPGSAIPTKPRDIIRACNQAYLSPCFAIIRNIIDLMADFATQGIDLYHEDEEIEAFYKEWFRRVGGEERSERFLNLLYRVANVLIKRETKDIGVKDKREMSQGEYTEAKKKPLPIEYTFLNIDTIDVLGEELSLFLGKDKFIFGLRLPRSFIQKVLYPTGPVERELVNRIPADIRAAIKRGDKHLPLNSEKVSAYYYKRDDWEVWARPFIYSLLQDLQLLQKMKLADMAALDGAMSCIRVWKLGNLENRIMPTQAAFDRLANMLINNIGGGVMDLVWGPDLELKETSTDVHRFLGETKYAPVLTAIHAGLGVPPTLTGANQSGGFTNNYISLKTMTERLQYGRNILTQFWENEIRLVQKAMGFEKPAELVFDRMTLTDEAAEKQLLIHLFDRDIISLESILERFGETPEIEIARIRREMAKRKKGIIPLKASPWHTPQQDFELKKIFSQSGAVTPSEVGLDLLDNKDGQETPAEHNARVAPKQQLPSSNKGQPGQGRPGGSRDKNKRKKKRVLPRSKADLLQDLMTAELMQTKIAKLVTPVYLKSLNKDNLRQLTTEEASAFEEFKFSLLFNVDFSEGEAGISNEIIQDLIQKPLPVPDQARALLKHTIDKRSEDTIPSVETVRRYQAGIYAFWNYSEETDSDIHSLS